VRGLGGQVDPHLHGNAGALEDDLVKADSRLGLHALSERRERDLLRDERRGGRQAGAGLLRAAADQPDQREPEEEPKPRCDPHHVLSGKQRTRVGQFVAGSVAASTTRIDEARLVEVPAMLRRRSQAVNQPAVLPRDSGKRAVWEKTESRERRTEE